MHMKGKIAERIALRMLSLGFMAWLVLTGAAYGQSASHFLGTLSAINGDTLTVKTAQGDERQVQVPSTAEVKRVAPGQTSLSAAVPMPFSELAAGDRVLIWIDPNSPAGSAQALRVVAIKQADIAQKQQQETEDWQKRGLGGLVKSVDATTGTIVLTVGAGPSMKTVTIHTTKATILKRYAAASVSYSSAQPAPFEAIHSRDQLMARGDKSADGSEVNAEEVVSGSFRNISGVILSLDPAHSTFTLKDLATKKPVTVQVPEDTQMRQLPPEVAQTLAARLKGDAAATGAKRPGAGPNSPSRPVPPPAPAAESGAPAQPQHHGWMQRGGGQGSMDPQQMLSHAPVIHFADLKKGVAVMLVATAGDAQVTAITLVSGVEPLLEAPASQNLLANWSMSSSAPEGGEAQ
jgi:hypothetical protein